MHFHDVGSSSLPAKNSYQPIPSFQDEPPSFGTIQNLPTPSTLLQGPQLGDTELEEGIETSQPSSQNRFWTIWGSLVSTTLAVGLLSSAILCSYGNAIKAIMMASFGFFALIPVVSLTPKNIANGIKDCLVDFSPQSYIFITNTAINIPTHVKLVMHLTQGVLSSLLGGQLSAQPHNFFKNWNPLDDFTALPDAEVELHPITQGEHQPYATDHRIPVLTSQRMSIGNTQLKASQLRCITLTFLGLIGSGVMVAGLVSSSALSMIGIRVGVIVLGLAMGGLVHEGIRAITKHLERTYENDPKPPLSLKFFRIIGKVEIVAGIVLVGMVGMNHTWVPFVASFCFGMKWQIEWIRFTRTPVSKLPELHPRNTTLTRSRCKSITNLVLGLIWGGFYLWQMVVGSNSERYALSTFTAVTYLTYILARRLSNSYDILKEENRLLNTLYFYLLYATSPAFFFIGITQVMEIGSKALEDYAVFQNLFACVAWADLGIAMGSHAASIETFRSRKYPANLSPLFSLYVYNFSQILFGVSSTDGGN